jgi:beta-lactamase regulating signal transducer with metallopeptidase domain
VEFLFEYSVSNAILAAGLALAVAGVTRLWRNSQLAHALWIIVLLKLVSPPLVSLPVNAFFASARHGLPPSNLVVKRQQPMPAPDPNLGTGAGLESLTSSGAPTDQYVRPNEFGTLDSTGTLETSLVAVEARPAPNLSWLPIVAAIWLTGSLLRLALVSSRVIRFHRIAHNMAQADAGTRKQAASLAKQLRLRHCPDIRVVEGRIPPMVWSAGCRPLVLLPVDLLARLDDEQKASLIMHELAHIRRCDHWIRWLEMAVLTICWWNPVAWWARSRIQRAEEECCDGWVVSTLPHCARQYGKALFETVEFLNERSQPLPAMASGFGYVPLVKRRIEMIVKRRVAHRLAWPGGLLVSLIAVVVLPVVAQNPGADTKPVVPSTEFERELKRLGAFVQASNPETQSRTTTERSSGTPAKVFRPLRSGIWRERADHKVDGKVVNDGWWDYQLDFRNDKVTGHVLRGHLVREAR